MLTTAILLAFPVSSAIASEGLNSGDTAWMIVSTALVMMMTPAGLALFQLDGTEALVRDVAAASGLGVATVYHYLGGKEDLLYHVQRRVLEAANPRLVVLVETELWPIMLLTAAERGVRIRRAILDQRDQAGQRAAIPGQHAFDERFGVGIPACHEASADLMCSTIALVLVPGPKIALTPAS